MTRPCADVVDLDEPDLIGVADAPEGPDEIARLDRPPGPGGEHEPGFRPGRAHVDPVGGLAFGLELERLGPGTGRWGRPGALMVLVAYLAM